MTNFARGLGLLLLFLTPALHAGCTSGPQGPLAPTPEEIAAYERGKELAKKAAASDAFIIKEYPPLPSPPGHAEYVELLKSRFHVDYVVMKRPGDIEENLFVEEVRGWNATMLAEIDNRFGDGALGHLRAEAEALHRERLKRGLQKDHTNPRQESINP